MIQQQPSQISQLMHVIEETTLNVPVTIKKVLYIFHTMAQQGGVIPTYKTFKNKGFRESLSMPDKIRNELEPLIKDKIIAIRANLRKKNEASKPKQDIPSQYPTMTKDTMLNLVTSMAGFGMEDDGYETDDDFLHETSAMMVRISVDPPEGNLETDIVVRAHFEYTNIPELKTKYYAISDSGADSCILEKMAKV